MDGMAQRFADALRKSEETRDPGPVASLFTPDAELRNLAHRESGADAAQRFWSRYLDQFDDIRSEFSHLIEEEKQAALVWTSKGTRRGGHTLTYRGVSILEFGDGKVSRFETIYDSAAFLTQGAEERPT